MNAHTANQIFARTVRSERRITGRVLKQILKFEDNKYHVELGYHSLFDWLTRGHRYDEGSANRRISAARIMRDVPEVEQKLQEGKTTLTNLVKVQTIFRHAGKLSREEKREVIERIEGQTTTQAAQTLFKMFPEAASRVNQDRKVVVDENQIRVSYNLTNEQAAILNHARELCSHAVPGGSEADFVTYLASYFVKREDPSVKAQSKRKDKPATTQTEASSFASKMASTNTVDSREVSYNSVESKTTAVASKQRVTIKVRNQVLAEDGRQCTYTDPVTGMRCNNRVRLEADHIQMRVHGGSNVRENLRCLCRVHNQFMAEKKLGKEWANRWRDS